MTDEKYHECLRKLREGYKGKPHDPETRYDLEARLDQMLKSGSMTVVDADAEWQDFMHRDEVWLEF